MSTRGQANTFRTLSDEVQQGHSIRIPIYERLSKHLGGRVVISYFTSFMWEGTIADSDADMIEEVLQNTPINGKELILVINSPGGDGLAAERIINIFRSYSPNGFSVIVPKMAKSAATMICFGAKKILMSKTSELGPIDPQIAIFDDNGKFSGYQAAHEIINSYEGLMARASKTKGRIEPYLQQLARFDDRSIQRIKSAQALSESIAVKCLKTGCMSNLEERQIRVKIKPFLDPKFTKDHGRPIYYDVARSSGLATELADHNSELWKDVWCLYVRLNFLVSSSASKVIESSTEAYTAPARLREH